MSDLPPPPPPPPGSGAKKPPLGPGVARGCGTVVLAVVAGSTVGSLVTQLSGKGSIGFTVAGAVIVTLIALATLKWRRVPGFLLGIIWFFALPLAVFTACVAILAAWSTSI